MLTERYVPVVNSTLVAYGAIGGHQHNLGCNVGPKIARELCAWICLSLKRKLIQLMKLPDGLGRVGTERINADKSNPCFPEGPVQFGKAWGVLLTNRTFGIQKEVNGGMRFWCCAGSLV